MFGPYVRQFFQNIHAYYVRLEQWISEAPTIENPLRDRSQDTRFLRPVYLHQNQRVSYREISDAPG